LKTHIESLPVEQHSEHQKLCLRLIEQYGLADIGILFTFFFNILCLKTGEAFVISPDEPHAYISGDLIEAMVSSDNVVRGGLTPKFKDTQTLMDMLIYEFKDRKPNSGEAVQNENQVDLREY
jgi:mannose-6-phosphate isomerase